MMPEVTLHFVAPRGAPPKINGLEALEEFLLREACRAKSWCNESGDMPEGKTVLVELCDPLSERQELRIRDLTLKCSPRVFYAGLYVPDRRAAQRQSGTQKRPEPEGRKRPRRRKRKRKKRKSSAESWRKR